MSYDDDDTPKVTAQSYGALDCSDVDNESWMVRIPPSLAAVWDKAPEGTVLGELIFTKGGSGKDQRAAGKKIVKPSIEIQVAQELLQESDEINPEDDTPVVHHETLTIPLNYSMQAMTKKVPGLHPFCRNAQTGSCHIRGTVTRTANLQVQQDQQYRQLLKDRLLRTSVNSNRFVKPVDAPQSVVAKQQRHRAPKSTTAEDESDHTFSSAVFQYGKRKLEAAQMQDMAVRNLSTNQRTRQFSPDQPIKSVIFELFSQQKYWTVKDLKGAAAAGGATSTKRTDTEIRDVLREIGEYHRSGDHKTMWELRKEFQQQQD